MPSGPSAWTEERRIILFFLNDMLKIFPQSSGLFLELKKPVNSIHLVDMYWGGKEDGGGPSKLKQPHTATRKPLHP